MSKPITKELEMKKIKMTKEQKKEFKHIIRQRAIAREAFSRASEMCHDTETRLWKKIYKTWPNAASLEHPDRGDWIVGVCSDDEKEPVIK